YSAEVALAYVEWDLWLRCATSGKWGYTIPEPLISYRGLDPSNPFRPVQAQEFQSFRQYLHERYGELKRQFPRGLLTPLVPYTDVVDDAPFVNDLICPLGTKRLLLLVPWLVVGGADRVNLDIMRHLSSVGYEFTIATTLPSAQHTWEDEFEAYTSDIFILERFLSLADIPRFLLFLIRSRKIDTVMIANSFLGYQLLPYLRSRCPDVTFVDYCHAEQEYWKNGGYPRCAAAYQELLDLNITSSLHVKEWLVARGAQPDRIEVCYTNVDTERWKPDPLIRQRSRMRLGLTDDMTLIIFVGRLTAEKRPYLIPKMIQGLLKSAAGRFLCLVIGDGPERDTIEQLTRSLRLGEHLRML